MPGHSALTCRLGPELNDAARSGSAGLELLSAPVASPDGKVISQRATHISASLPSTHHSITLRTVARVVPAMWNRGIGILLGTTEVFLAVDDRTIGMLMQARGKAFSQRYGIGNDLMSSRRQSSWRGRVWRGDRHSQNRYGDREPCCCHSIRLPEVDHYGPRAEDGIWSD
ncbi:hypothetical protein BDZ90DRAFT_195117 [Jaminaea rosea]|uniref:Uncharacterized protein n=1 Tax=Jaminaea rosea TaxID=1569628 RepID=A0A316UNN8_9BASI|nr:hypothetical protein BDZ90DRAFT_195117 [Jaminaea rosea]PWN26922.1 hypothetical protein BDZ90DRAFT_195117 [Jaminaea rosea]